MSPTAPPKKVAPPRPPRALILMEATTNPWAAAHFTKHGYCVELILDLKYCNTALLKSAKYIVLGPNSEKSPFYDKVKQTLKKMVPDRLFEEEGAELLAALRSKVVGNAQNSQASHRSDGQMITQARESQDRPELSKLTNDHPPSLPSINNSLHGIIATIAMQSAPISTIKTLGSSLLKGNLEPCSFPVSEDLEQILTPYLKICLAMGLVDLQRSTLCSSAECPDDAKEELNKQLSSLKKPLSPEKQLEKSSLRNKKLESDLAAGPNRSPRKLPEGDIYDQVMDLEQWTESFIEEKAKIRLAIQKNIAQDICKDRFHKIGCALGLPCDPLHGEMYLFLALSSIRIELQSKLSITFKKLTTLAEQSDTPKKSSSLSFFSSKKQPNKNEPSENPELDSVAKELSDLIATCTILDHELPFYEKNLCNYYWTVHEKASELILKGSLQNKTFSRYLRAFMRFGLITDHASIISPSQANHILNSCDDVRTKFQHEDGLSNIVYPDEALEQIRDGFLPASFNEELELENQGSPKHKVDKTLRKIYASKFKINVYEREWRKWLDKNMVKKEAQKSAELMLNEHEKGSKDYKVTFTALREAKTEISRGTKIVEKLENIVVNEEELLSEQEKILEKIQTTLSPSEIAQNESKTMRSMCKLLNNRKENFMPFMLRDNFDPTKDNTNDRKVINNALSEFETNDPSIFTLDINNANNPRKQVLIRFSPTIIIYPVVGNMGFCLAPNNSADPGRLILPLLCDNQVPLTRMMIDMFADFRYDTAKDRAGIDLMTSDTICAAYAKVRWNYRKKGKEFREKAAIYNELQDKKNFAIHYRLYIESMDESGKKLFFKCYEMYEGFLKYIPLAKGKAKLSKA
jgi:hypothetical protein